MYFIYIIQGKNDQLYKGITTNLTNRIQDHNAGRTRSTKAGRPWKLIYFEKIKGYSNARLREKYLKSAAGRRWIEKNIHLWVPRPID
ncbi:GIY-YIG nuclease family protein [Fulvivirga sedimenti]|uniref:GIY-YIG nuclease family protein n=1 Tax=Fulvivirga sedimenti TaxID=2879465 RepID=A0A9X1HVY1_9BACT|nr:GIY-YIG nuclease family protein [Fulvivirga sedimenti]